MKMNRPAADFGQPSGRKQNDTLRWVVCGAFCLLIAGATASMFSGARRKTNPLPPKPTPKPTATSKPTPKPIAKVPQRVHNLVEAHIFEEAQKEAKEEALKSRNRILLDPDKIKVRDRVLANIYLKYAKGRVLPKKYSPAAVELAMDGVKKGNLDVASSRVRDQAKEQVRSIRKRRTRGNGGEREYTEDTQPKR